MIQFFIVKFEKVPFANSFKSLMCLMKRQSILIIAIIAIVAIVSIAIVSVAIIPIAVGGSGGCWLCSCRSGGCCPSRGSGALPTCDQVLDPGQVVLDSSVDPRRGRGAPHAIAYHPNQCVFTVLWNSKRTATVPLAGVCALCPSAQLHLCLLLQNAAIRLQLISALVL